MSPATTSSNQWSTYSALLRGEQPAISADEFCSGYYKVRKERGGEWFPLGIWRAEDQVFCFLGLEAVADHDEILRLFLYGVKNPIHKTDYDFWLDNQRFPGDIDTPAASFGHNSGLLNAREELLDMIDLAVDWAGMAKSEMSGLFDKTTADRAANYDDTIVALSKAVKEERDEALKPLQQRVADLKLAQIELREAKENWKALIDQADDARETLKGVYMSWQRDQSIRGLDTKCGGQSGRQKGYVKRNDPLHPDNLAADKLQADLDAQKSERIARREAAEIAEELAANGGIAIVDWDAAISHYANHPDVKSLIMNLVRDDISKTGEVPAFARAEVKLEAAE